MGLQFIDAFASEKLGLKKLPFYWSFVGFLFVRQVLGLATDGSPELTPKWRKIIGDS
jgi:hypothetical protein